MDYNHYGKKQKTKKKPVVASDTIELHFPYTLVFSHYSLRRSTAHR